MLNNYACVQGSINGTPISFKVLPMVPLLIPLVPMVMLMVLLALPMVPLVISPMVPLVANGTIDLPMVPLGEPRTELYVDIGARTQGVSGNLDQTQIFLLYLTIFNSVVPVILMLLGVKTITVSLKYIYLVVNVYKRWRRGCQNYNCLSKMHILW